MFECAACRSKKYDVNTWVSLVKPRFFLKGQELELDQPNSLLHFCRTKCYTKYQKKLIKQAHDEVKLRRQDTMVSKRTRRGRFRSKDEVEDVVEPEVEQEVAPGVKLRQVKKSKNLEDWDLQEVKVTQYAIVNRRNPNEYFMCGTMKDVLAKLKELDAA